MQQREVIDALVKTTFETNKGWDGAEQILYDLVEKDNLLDIKTIRKDWEDRVGSLMDAKALMVTTPKNCSISVWLNLSARDSAKFS